MSTETRSTDRGGVIARLARFQRDRRGTAFVEFALVAPIMILLFFGTVEFSQAIMANRRVTKVTSSIADLVARSPNTGLTCAQVNNILEIGSVLMEPYDTDDLSITLHVMQTTNAAGSTYSLKWKKHNGRGTEAPTPTVPTGLSRSLGEHVVVAHVDYPYDSPITKYVLKNQFTLSETFYLKPRQGTANITGRETTFNYTCP